MMMMMMSACARMTLTLTTCVPKNKVCRSKHSEVRAKIAQIDTQTRD